MSILSFGRATWMLSINYKWCCSISTNISGLHLLWEPGHNLLKIVHRHNKSYLMWLQERPSLVGTAAQAQLIQMVVWMLQRRLLIQLHTYVCLMVPPSEDEPSTREEDPPLRVGGRSLSTPSALSFGSPSKFSFGCSTPALLVLSALLPVFSQQWRHDPHQPQYGQFQRRAAAWRRLAAQQEDHWDAARQSVGAREAGYSQCPCCPECRRSEDVCQVKSSLTKMLKTIRLLKLSHALVSPSHCLLINNP